MEGTSVESRRRLVALLVLCAALFFVGLGHYDLDAKAEPREGLTAWEMIHSGNWMLPSLNGEVLPEKPLLFPWLVALSTLLFGEASEWATRLPAALSAVGLVLVVFALGRRLLGERGGFLAAAATASTFLVVSLGRRARVDMTLAFLVTAAIWLFVEDFRRAEEAPDERPSRGRLLVFWLAIAAATLTKGPLGAVLVALAILPYLFARKRLGYLRRLCPWWGVAAFAVVAGSWYVNGLEARGGDFGYRSFLMENLLMFVGDDRGGGHRHELTFFVGHYLVDGLPWSLLLPAAIVWSLRDKAVPFRQRLSLPLLWFATMFVFFSVAAGKRADYMLPLVPAASLLVAAMWDDARHAFLDVAVRRTALTGAALALVVGIAGVAAGAAFLLVPAESWPAGLAARLDGEDVRAFRDALEGHGVLLAIGAVGALAALVAPLVGILGARPRRAVLVAAGGVAVAAACAPFALMPAIAAHGSMKPFAAEVARVAGPDATIRNYSDFQPAVLFYLRRRLPALGPRELEDFLAEPGDGWVLTDEESWDGMPPGRKARFVAVVTTGRHCGDATDRPVLIRKRTGP